MLISVLAVLAGRIDSDLHLSLRAPLKPQHFTPAIRTLCLWASRVDLAPLCVLISGEQIASTFFESIQNASNQSYSTPEHIQGQRGVPRGVQWTHADTASDLVRYPLFVTSSSQLRTALISPGYPRRDFLKVGSSRVIKVILANVHVKIRIHAPRGRET